MIVCGFFVGFLWVFVCVCVGGGGLGGGINILFGDCYRCIVLLYFAFCLSSLSLWPFQFPL